VDYNVTHVVAAKDGTNKVLSARRTPGCMVLKSAWLMECYWSISLRDVNPFLMHHGTGDSNQNRPIQNNILRQSNIENSSEGSSNDSDDDDFAADFEDELMDT
jgi:RNA polymerase II subunit A-like phosphatase